jgi:hypothetical protein
VQTFSPDVSFLSEMSKLSSDYAERMLTLFTQFPPVGLKESADHKVQYLPKVWKRARARERTLWRLAFFLGDPKNPIFVGSR